MSNEITPGESLPHCQHPPIPEIEIATNLLSDAARCYVDGDLDEARRLIREADDTDGGKLWQHWDTKAWKNLYPELVLPRVPESERVPPFRSKRLIRELYERDGFRCRLCGIRVVDPEVLEHFMAVPRLGLRWGDRDPKCHTGLRIVLASPDHVIPRSKGGTNECDNLVTACSVCQFGRSWYDLAQSGVADPFKRDPVLDGWIGLREVLR